MTLWLKIENLNGKKKERMIDWIDDIEAGELFNLSVEDRIKVIEGGVDLVLQEVIMNAEITERPRAKVLNQYLYALDVAIEGNEYKDEYEVCYYLTEVKWGIHRRLKTNKI
jgi:hypothetical protein